DLTDTERWYGAPPMGLRLVWLAVLVAVAIVSGATTYGALAARFPRATGTPVPSIAASPSGTVTPTASPTPSPSPTPTPDATVDVTKTAVPGEFHYLVLGTGNAFRVVLLDLGARTSTDVASVRLATAPSTAAQPSLSISASADRRIAARPPRRDRVRHRLARRIDFRHRAERPGPVAHRPLGRIARRSTAVSTPAHRRRSALRRLATGAARVLVRWPAARIRAAARGPRLPGRTRAREHAGASRGALREWDDPRGGGRGIALERRRDGRVHLADAALRVEQPHRLWRRHLDLRLRRRNEAARDALPARDRRRPDRGGGLATRQGRVRDHRAADVLRRE